MADNDDPTGMTPEDQIDAARFDEERFDDVAAALAGLSFLRPDAPSAIASDPDEAGSTMPDWAWDRLSLAIGNEAAARAAAAHDNVVAFPASSGPSVSGPPAADPVPAAASTTAEPRRFRWVGGLVAASVAVLAITVGVQVMGGSSTSSDIVAGGAPAIVETAAALKAVPPSVAAAPNAQAAPAAASPFSATDTTAESAPSSAPAASAPAAVGASPSVDVRALPSPGAEQPSKLVVDSNTQYTQAGLSGQVTALLNRLGVHSAREAEQMPPQKTAMPVEDGFTSSWVSLRDCLSWLAKSQGVQALVVDRGTFEGVAAGVIVMPAEDVKQGQTPEPTATVESGMGAMNVWVVDPSCRHQVDSIMEYLPYTLVP